MQNLTCTFHTTRNNGQTLSRKAAVSAETVSNAWGLAWSYDGFGNRTNQSVTKGSAPMHSVAIDAATNRIATAGHQYDANGNLTQMPLMTMGYDVANRMVTSNHSARVRRATATTAPTSTSSRAAGIRSPNFFANVAGGHALPLANQQATLVHEFIHASLKMGKGNDHSDIFKRFGIAIAPNQSVGDAIQNWIQADCPTPPAAGRGRGRNL